MKLAINYSPAAAYLVKTGQIDIDLFKVPEWMEMIDSASKYHPVYVHFTLAASPKSLNQVNWSEIEQAAQSTHTPYINLHLEAAQEDFPDIPQNSTAQQTRRDVYNSLLAGVMTLVERLGSERVIVENSWYRGMDGKYLRACVEPEVINKVVEESGCGFLMDISHAVIAAFNLGIDPHHYMLQLPVDRVKELHFAGIHQIDGQWIDHLSILEQDWHWLDWVFERIGRGDWSQPWLLAFEYGGVGQGYEWRSDPLVIEEQTPLLYKRICDLNMMLPG